MNFDASSPDYNSASVIKFLTTVDNLMAKESARVNIGDISGDNITDILIEGNSKKANRNQRVIGSVMDPQLKTHFLKKAGILTATVDPEFGQDGLKDSLKTGLT